MKYSRIIIVGSAGSGKSYLAKRMAEITGYPFVHLDNEYWKPGWVKTPREEWIASQKKMMNTEQWIIDGNYNSTMELRFEASDAVIFLDINRFVCIYSAIKRHGKKRSDLPDYLTENFDKEFIEFLKWIWEFPKTGKKRIVELHNIYAEKPFIVLKSRKEVNQFIQEQEIIRVG